MAEEGSDAGGWLSTLPEDLVDEILVRLPVKSVLRFKSVCKTWHSLLRSAAFIKTYGKRQRGRPCDHKIHSITKERLGWEVPELHLPPPEKTLRTRTRIGECWKRGKYVVIGPSTTGVYCVISYESEIKSGSRSAVLSTTIAFYNPATRSSKIATRFPHHLRPLLAQTQTPYYSGQLHFGFSMVGTDYRVVLLILCGKSFIILVYSQESGEWTKLVHCVHQYNYEYGEGIRFICGQTEAFSLQPGKSISRVSSCLEACSQRLFRGCSYWTVTHQDESFSVLLFNFADQLFESVSGPPLPHVMHNPPLRKFKPGTLSCKPQAFVLHHHLAMLKVFYHHHKGNQLCLQIAVWMMMEYGVEDSWALIYTINPRSYDDYTTLYGVDYRLQNDRILIDKLFFEPFGEENKSRHEICWNTPGISTYAESLQRL